MQSNCIVYFILYIGEQHGTKQLFVLYSQKGDSSTKCPVVSIHERRQLWVSITVLMLISTVEAIRLDRSIKRESSKKDD